MNTMEEKWNLAQKNGDKLDYRFSKIEAKVPNEARQNIGEMIQLPNISRMEIRPNKDTCAVSFRVSKDKNKAKELIGNLCSMIEVWRCHDDIVVSAVPKRIFYKKLGLEK